MGSPSAASTGGGGIVARFRTTGTVILLTVFYMEVPTLAMTAGLCYSIARHSSGGTAITGIFTAVMLPFAILGVVWMLRPTTLTGDRLLVPRGLHRHRVVALTDIAAVGMVYVHGSRSAGWDPYVWLGDGSRLRIPGQRFAGQSVYRSAAKTAAHPPSWQKIADSPAGRMCQALRNAALAAEANRGGALASEHAGFRSPSDGDAGVALASWSADPAAGIAMSADRSFSP
jgi:hypothetical protein